MNSRHYKKERATTSSRFKSAYKGSSLARMSKDDGSFPTIGAKRDESRDDSGQAMDSPLSFAPIISIDRKQNSRGYSEGMVSDLHHRDNYQKMTAAQLASMALSSEQSVKSVQSLHLELLNAEKERLHQKVAELQRQFESSQTRNAHDRSKIMIKQRELAVEIEILQEDKVYLAEKHALLGGKLLDLHMQKLSAMEDQK